MMRSQSNEGITINIWCYKQWYTCQHGVWVWNKSHTSWLSTTTTMRSLSATQKSTILSQLDSGHSIRSVASSIGVGIATISRLRSKEHSNLQKSGLNHMIIGSADSQGLLLHTPPPMLSGILMPTHTISYAVQNHQTLEQFLESLYICFLNEYFPPKTTTYCLILWSNYSSFHIIPQLSICWSMHMIQYYKYYVICTLYPQARTTWI